MNLVRETFPVPKAIIGLCTLLTGADDDKIVTVANMKVGDYTIAAQPSVPSLIGITHASGDTTDTLGTITVIGTDTYKQALSETVTPEADGTVWTTRYFRTITKITGADWVIDGVEGTADTIKIGVPASGGLEVKGHSVTIVNLSGNTWVNPDAVAVADATSFKLVGDMTTAPLKMTVKDTLSLISDGTGSTFQAIIWEQ